jgi:hypothetical protein
MYPEESEKVQIYDRMGNLDSSIKFNARYYLNRIVTQYKRVGKCDGGKVGGCDCDYGGCKANFTQAFLLSSAFEIIDKPSGSAPTKKAPNLVCDNVPHYGQSWWAGFMSWPTFTAFVAPYVETIEVGPGQTIEPMSREESETWLHTLSYICDFDNFTKAGNYKIGGAVCQKTYFHASQEVISTMVMSGSMLRLFEKETFAEQSFSMQSVSEQRSFGQKQMTRSVSATFSGQSVAVKAAVDTHSQDGWIPGDHHSVTALAGALAVSGLAVAIAFFVAQLRRSQSGHLQMQQRPLVRFDTDYLVYPADKDQDE